MPRQAGKTKPPITVQRIVDAALAIVDADGYGAVSMRAIAARLDTGQSSLYAHVANKLELDRALVTRLWSGIRVPDPDPARWREQLVEVYLRQADLFARHPGIEGAYFASTPTEPPMLEFVERVSALYEAGGFTGAAVRQLEATLEAMTVAWGIQTTTLVKRLETLGLTQQQFYAATLDSLARVDSERFPRVIAGEYHTPADPEIRAADFRQRLHTVIDGFAAVLPRSHAGTR